jgi:porphobilinogen synthase
MPFPIHRPRRLRRHAGLRRLCRETVVRPADLISPLFVMEGLAQPSALQAMPGQFQWPVTDVLRPIDQGLEAGVTAFLLFGIPAGKDPDGAAAAAADGIVVQAIRKIKAARPEAIVMTDVCLCAYTTHGHCGVLDETGHIRNDVSLPRLAAMARAHAAAGADVVAPSDMMDGRVGFLRRDLDENGFAELPIMAYSAKFASAFYGPFREAAHSAPQSGDRRGYQLDAANRREALREMVLDLEEGADVLMVKPAMPYLDILREARELFDCPLAAYQVSGEYAMIKAAAANGWLDERAPCSNLCWRFAGRGPTGF